MRRTREKQSAASKEITTGAKLDYDKVVRGVVAQIGFDSFVDDLSSVDSKGLSHKTCHAADCSVGGSGGWGGWVP